MSVFQPGSPLWAKFVDPERSSLVVPAPRTSKGQPWSILPGMEKLPPPPGAAEGCPLPYDWESRRYAAFDVETTGLDSWRNRIVEIGLVLFHYDAEGALVPEGDWSTLINPCVPIPPSATEIHGIRDHDVLDSPRFSDIAYELLDKLQGRVLVAHNASFDMGFLGEEYSRIRLPAPVLEIADSLQLLRLASPNLISFNLGKAAFILGIDTGTSHRALDDAKTCMHLFTHSARKLAGRCL